MECRSNKWIASFLPVFGSSSAQPAEVISFTSVPPPTENTDIFTLSRDGYLRRWSVLKGCQAECNAAVKAGINHQNDKPIAIIEGSLPKLLRICTIPNTKDEATTPTPDARQVLLICLPTPLSTTSGGIFQVRDLETLVESNSCPASTATTNCRLQDFIVVKDVLYALWEKQGKSLLEMRKFVDGRFEGEWVAASPGQATDLSQVLSDELLLQPGCLVDKFIQAILRPGVFSNLTLRSALQDYKEHYLSLPGSHAPALLTSHATLSEDEGFDLATFDERNWPATDLPSFRVLKNEPYSTFKARVAQHFNYPENQVRLWVLVNRQNKTVRPDTHIPENEPQLSTSMTSTESRNMAHLCCSGGSDSQQHGSSTTERPSVVLGRRS